MTDETAIELVQNVELVEDRAHENYRELCFRKSEIETGFLVMARLLKENRDQGYWKLLGYDSFEIFLADPDLAFKRSTAYNLIRHTELYENELGIPEELLVSIGSRRLQIIAPVVKDDPAEWLNKAQALSKSDLMVEVHDAQVLAGKLKQRAGAEEGLDVSRVSSFLPPMSLLPRHTPSTWIDMVKKGGCCVCGNTPVDVAHFPRTKGAGGKDHHVIPLCRFCHTEQHNGGKDWLWENRVAIFGWFYGKLMEEPWK
jgi:hypothetical protein